MWPPKGILRRRSPWPWRTTWLVLIGALFSVARADGADRAGTLEALGWRVLSPDVVRRGERWNVLVIVTATQDATERSVTAELLDGRGALEAERPEELRVTATVSGGAVARLAFRGLRVSPDSNREEVELRLVFEVDGAREELPLRIATVRGPLVPRGSWSILVPALISLLVVPAFAWLLRRHARAGAWRTVESPRIPEESEAWWVERS